MFQHKRLAPGYRLRPNTKVQSARGPDRSHKAYLESADFLRAHEVKALKLSIVTAVYNRQATIAQAIASVSAQSYQDVEQPLRTPKTASTSGVTVAAQSFVN